MRYRKRVLILLATAVILALVLRNYLDIHEDIIHLKSDNKEFKQKPEKSIESTILHGEKEVYNHVFSSDH